MSISCDYLGLPLFSEHLQNIANFAGAGTTLSLATRARSEQGPRNPYDENNLSRDKRSMSVLTRIKERP